MHLRHCVLFFQTGFTHHGSYLVAGRVHVQGCRDGHFVFASRLGSLSTVFTWLRSRACAGMQGLGVLALVVVAPCGFAAHVASEEAVLSSPRNRFAPFLGPVPLPPTFWKSPWTPRRALVPSPTPQGILQKTPFCLWTPPPRALVPSPTPQCFKKKQIFLKNTTQVPRPVPLPPTPPAPNFDPPPEPQTSGLALPLLEPSPNPPPSLKLPSSPYTPPKPSPCQLWGRAPTTYPPTTKALRPLPEPQPRA